MTPTPPSFTQASAEEALCEQVERELRALTIARIDGPDAPPRRSMDASVDAYADGVAHALLARIQLPVRPLPLPRATRK